MSTPKPNPQAIGVATSASTSNTRSGVGPATPLNSTIFTNISTPKSHQHGSFASPAQKSTPRAMGTPSRATRGGKSMPGAKRPGGKTLGAGSETGGLAGLIGGGSPAFTFGTPNFNFGSPAVNITSPNMNGLGTMSIDALANPSVAFGGYDGGVGMGISLSSLGINMSGTAMTSSVSAMGKADDAERRRRLEAVLQILSQRTGRISREGIERLGRRCGLDIQAGEVDELAMAGKNVMVDIKFAPHQSQSIDHLDVLFATAPDSMTELGNKAGSILRQDLLPLPGVAPVNATLERFADNLKRLAIMDQLSTPGASCFDAVFGIYTSLRRLYEHEREVAEKLYGATQTHRADYEVMCKKSGKPLMHPRARVGLGLDYWTCQHLVQRPEATSMEQMRAQSHTPFDDGEKTSSLVIECEPITTALYPSISITHDWISERVEKPPEDTVMTSDGALDEGPSNTKPVIDWLEPPPLELPPPEATVSQAINDNISIPASHPAIRFVARLEPPVAIPLLVAAQVYASVGVDISQDLVSNNTIPSLILPQHFNPILPGELLPKAVRTPRTVIDSHENQHHYDLGFYPTRNEVARRIESLPFAHPRQLVAILPLLRQYTFISQLLQNTFSSTTTPVTATGPLPDSCVTTHFAKTKSSRSGRHIAKAEADLAALLNEETSPQTASKQSIDIAFTITPIPQMTVIFTSLQGPKRVTFNILPNAEIEVVEQNVVEQVPGQAISAADKDGDGQPRKETMKKKAEASLAHALAVCEDLVIWVEWMKGKMLTPILSMS